MDQSKEILATDSVGTNREENQGTNVAMRMKMVLPYIYQTLFKGKRHSDIEVKVLGRVWNLHKIILEQSPYFRTMFNGTWKESSESSVHIQIDDKRIDEDALDAVFGSLYSDQIDITPKNVISILATASLFLMDSIIERCAEVMIENINRETAIDYYECACLYNCINVKKITFEWLELNLLEAYYYKYSKPLIQISVELMTSLVSSSDLFVETEIKLYKFLRTWIYMRLHPDQSQTHYTYEVARLYFVNRPKGYSFLATSEGQPYIKLFQALRTQDLVAYHMDLNEVLADNITPKEWLHSHILSNWQAILKVNRSAHEGPQNLEHEVFLGNCMRFTISKSEPGWQTWTLMVFNFGLNLKFVLDARLLTVCRHHGNENVCLLSSHKQRHFMIRVSVASINAQCQPVHTQKSDILSLSLKQNEEATLMTLDTNHVYPLLISVNLLAVPPTVQTFKEQPLLPPSEDVSNSTPSISEICTDCQKKRSLHSNAHASNAVCKVPSSVSSSSVATNTDASISTHQVNCSASPRSARPVSPIFKPDV